MQCFIDEIMVGVYLPYKFKLSSNPFRRRNLRLVLSYLSLGILAPYLLEEWIFYWLKRSDQNLPNEVENNPSKSSYGETIHHLKTEELFGHFWKDIFSLKIRTRKDDEKRLSIQENLQSHHLVNGFTADTSVSKRIAAAGIPNYIRKVMLFNSTPKVNLVGYFLAELIFFMIMMLYALFGLTYYLKQLDYFMLASWIYYFLHSFRNEFELIPIIQFFHKLSNF